MPVTATLKRQNFNITPEEDAQLQELQSALGAASIKDALLRATRVVLTLSQEVRDGKRIYSGTVGGEQSRILLPDFEALRPTWKYLSPRPTSWKRQLFVKGRRLTAASVWLDMLANHRTIEETAENWNLPIDAIVEILRYCQTHEPIIKMECEEEKRILMGVITKS